MKLSDIFNINLNTGGGNKLFARIMNKYNVPKKEYKDIRKGLKEESGSSSSTTSNVKYYSFDPDKNEFSDEGISMLSQIVISIKGIFYGTGKYYSILPTYIYNVISEYPFDSAVGCKIDYNADFINFYVGDENGNPIYLNSLYDYLSRTSIMIGVSSIEELLSKLGLTECTKEEFYDLNNI